MSNFYLYFVQAQDKAEMTIGSHFLEGKIVKLGKPFLVTEDVTGDTGEAQFRVLGTAHRKILFNLRPRIRT